ncbi:MAG TPA: S8 family serine peptidase [Mycobacteriales bacterium]|jgi:serine protease AprX|nr:S8 family serine peptidase [Mycobacteriales bacterium]
MKLRRGAALAAVATVGLTAGAAPPAQADLLGGLLGTVTGTVGALVGVVSTALDTTTGLLTGADWGYSASQTSMTSVNQTIGADKLQSLGYTGKGVGVALIDTGVVNVKGLTSGNVVNGPDLSLDNPSTQLRDLDGFGHGTHMAGIIAGNDGTLSGFKGVAPGAKLVSIKTGANSGAVDVSQVIAAIDWVAQHHADNGWNVRVINLSYGTDGVQSYQIDPLAAAVEHAWKAGVVVVVSGGNTGTTRSTLDNPAIDPYVIAVGADDTQSTTSPTDDTIPDFSARGSAARHVDLVAPGQSIVSLRNPGSVIDTEYPSAVVNTRFFKGSGTSQATAVVSGAVALLLQQHPSYTPDQVKAALMASAEPLPQAGSQDRGAGLLNVFAASTTLVGSSTQTWPASSGLGTLEGARGTDHVGDNGTDLTGEMDIFGKAWNASTWAAASASYKAWNGGVWNGSTWTGSCWCGSSWTNSTWSNSTWSGSDWANSTWSSHTWSGESWSNSTWSGSGWVSHTWSSHTWSGSSWG